jgi:hypothetical protein
MLNGKSLESSYLEVPLELTWCVLGTPEVSAFEIVECEDDLVTIKY